MVERVTGVAVRETIPDSFLKQADQVVNLDLAVEDLQERLRAGKIYAADKIPWALEHFFKEQNLAHLRELALREVAESVERASAERPIAGGRRRPRPTSTRSRVMVCLSSSPPRAATLAAQGVAAGRAVQHRLVRGVRRDPDGDARPHRRRGPAAPAGQHRAGARAGGGGGAAARRAIRSHAILDFARSHSVGHIVVGRSHQPWWKQRLGRTIPLQLVREGHGIDVHVVSLEDEPEPEGERQDRDVERETQ